MKIAERMRRDGWRLIGTVWQGRHAGLIVDIRDGEASAFHHSKERASDRVLRVPTEARHGLRSLAQRAKAAARRLAAERKRMAPL